ncbi:MAG: hypothetical protein E7774_11770, partial [Bradyrhizobium sp.]
VIREGSSREFLVEEFNRILISRVALPGFRRGIEVFEEKKDLLPFEEAKLYGHNAAHALLGFLAHQEGHLRISDTSEPLRRFVREAFIEESGRALIAMHGGVDELFTPRGFEQYASDLLERMVNPWLNDLVARVIRDPRRKLGWNDRLIGTMQKVLDAGMIPHRFAEGAAAAFALVGGDVRDLWPEPDLPRGRKRALQTLIAKASAPTRVGGADHVTLAMKNKKDGRWLPLGRGLSARQGQTSRRSTGRDEMVSRKKVLLAASGDLRQSANEASWPAQEAMEKEIVAVLAEFGVEVERAHPYDPFHKHGFISSQKQGLEIFANLDSDTPIIIAEAVWQYTNHVLPGLLAHRAPILTVANWSGKWPGLVGMLNLNGSLTKAGKKYSTLWSETFVDEPFKKKLHQWLSKGRVTHDLSHVHDFDPAFVPAKATKVAAEIAADLRSRRAIMGTFDEGCMGMYNAIIPDELLFPLGVFKERMSQSALYAESRLVTDAEAKGVYDWLVSRGFTFHFGQNGKTELTLEQVLGQCRMYIAAARIVETFGCDVIGIQYQQGMKDLMPASDLVEGMLNSDDRPPVLTLDGKLIREGRAIVHFNEVDECAGLDALFTSRIHRALGQPAETTLHDIRWGDSDHSGTTKDYVWVLQISGAAPPAHHIGGWAGSDSMRQPAMYFPFGGGTLRGVAKPGPIVWSRIFVEGGKLKMDLGRAHVVELPKAETQRRWSATTLQWPIMHAVLHGVTRDQMMARHKANHIQVAYARSETEANLAMATKAALAAELGIKVSLCGAKRNGSPLLN